MAYFKCFTVQFDPDAADPESTLDPDVTVNLQFTTTTALPLMNAISELMRAFRHILSCDEARIHKPIALKCQGHTEPLKRLILYCDPCHHQWMVSFPKRYVWNNYTGKRPGGYIDPTCFSYTDPSLHFRPVHCPECLSGKVRD